MSSADDFREAASAVEDALLSSPHVTSVIRVVVDDDDDDVAAFAVRVSHYGSLLVTVETNG